MAVWGNYLCVRQVAPLQKNYFSADQGPANSKWFSFLSRASSCSIPVQPDIPAAPHAFSLFIHAQYHTLPFPWYFFSHLASSHTLLLPLSPVHHGLVFHQHLSPGLQLCIWTIARVSQSLLCLGYPSCRAAYRREDRGRRKERSLPRLLSVRL